MSEVRSDAERVADYADHFCGDLQVVEEGSDIVLASARLVGRETIPVANAETLLNTPALERDLQSPTQRSNLPPSPDCTASIKLPVCCKDSHQIVETGTEHGLISRGGENTTGASKYRDPEPLGSRASGCCGCVSPSSDERAFVISTAEADWGVSIGKWKSESAHVGSSCGQLQVQLHRLCDAKGTCTDVWRHRASSDEVSAPAQTQDSRFLHFRQNWAKSES